MDYNIETTFNIGSSVMRALDFSVDIEDDDLFPPEDLRSRRQRSGSKLASHRSGYDLFEKNRKSNQGNILQGDRLFQLQRQGRNNR